MDAWNNHMAMGSSSVITAGGEKNSKSEVQNPGKFQKSEKWSRPASQAMALTEFDPPPLKKDDPPP
jgi:hypothetical protein